MMKGERAAAERLNAMFEPLWSLFKKCGSFRVMYAIGSLLGLFEAEPPRPVLPVPASARPRIEAALDELG